MHAELIVSVGDRAEQRHMLRPGKTFVIGRGRNAGIRLEDGSVSRSHAAVELKPDGLFVTDLRSRNGVLYEGKRLDPREPTLIPTGEAFQIADFQLKVELFVFDDGSDTALALDLLQLSADEFEIIGEIGRGSKGRVWAAEQKLIGRKVAIKMLKLELVADGEERQRFTREAQLCSRVRSPYVVEVFDVRFAREHPILIMELISGPSAKDRVDSEGSLSVEDVLGIGEDIAWGLWAAHESGVIHRDVKPQNILITHNGVAKLGDFGIAKRLSPDATALTESGVGLGTLAYVSPEQALNAKAADSRSDIYSLGASLYHLIAGRAPFVPRRDEHIVSVLQRIISQNPPNLTHLRPDCPEQVSELIHGMLAKSPDKRPQTADGVATELRRLRRGQTPGDLLQTQAD